jgi:tetratricopeptide (TPR) repeat protein
MTTNAPSTAGASHLLHPLPRLLRNADTSALSVLPHEREELLLPDTPVHIVAAEIDDPHVRQYFASTPATTVAAVSSARHMIRRYGVEHQVHKTIDSFGSRGGLTWIHGVGGSGKTVLASQVTTARAGRRVVGPISVTGSNAAMLKRSLASALSGSLIDFHLGSVCDSSTRTKRINAASLDEVLTIFISAVNACVTNSTRAAPLLLIDDVPYNDRQLHEALARLATVCTVVATSRVAPPACLSVVAKAFKLPSLSHDELSRLHHEVSAVVSQQSPSERHDPLAADWEQLHHASNDNVFVITRLLFRWLEIAPGSNFTGFMARTSGMKHHNVVAPDDNFRSSVGDLLEYELELAHARQPLAAMMLRYVHALQLSTFHGDVLVGTLGDEAVDGLRWLADRQLIAPAAASPQVFTVHKLVLDNLRWSCQDDSSQPRHAVCCWPGRNNLVRMLGSGAFPNGDRAVQPSHRIECHTCWIQAIHRQSEAERDVRCLSEDDVVDLCLCASESATGSGMKTLERDIYARLFFTTVAASTMSSVSAKKLCDVARAALDNASEQPERDNCERILREALDETRRMHADLDDTGLAASLNNVGSSLEAMGQREEGVALQREALEMRRRLYCDIDHPDVATSLNNLGSSLEAMGQREEGVVLQREALEMRRRLYRGIDHPHVATSLNNVGSSLEAMGQSEEGVALQREALEMRRRLYRGIDHPHVATSLNNVGSSLEAMGQSEEGVALQREALEMYRRLYGSIDHPGLATSVNNLGSSLEAMGQREEGVALQREALEMRRRLYGVIDHPDLAASLNTVGSSLDQMGQSEEGVALQREALEMYRRLYCVIDHPDLAASLNNVGSSLEAMGQSEEGVALQREALEMYRRLYGVIDHPDLVASLNNVGSSLEAMGQREEGVALQREALEMYRRLYGVIDHPGLATASEEVLQSLSVRDDAENAARGDALTAVLAQTTVAKATSDKSVHPAATARLNAMTQSTTGTVCSPEAKPAIELPDNYVAVQGIALVAALVSMSKEFPNVPAMHRIVNESERLSKDRLMRLAARGNAVLTLDEALVIALYTYDLGTASTTEDGSDNFFYACNDILRRRPPTQFKALRPFIAVFKSAMAALPVQKGIVYRGIPATAADEIATHYSAGMSVHWSGITSVASDLRVAKDFAGSSGIVFCIRMVNGRDLAPYSCFSSEHEFVLLPDAKLVVVGGARVEGGMTQYELQQVVGEYKF